MTVLINYKTNVLIIYQYTLNIHSVIKNAR